MVENVCLQNRNRERPPTVLTNIRRMIWLLMGGTDSMILSFHQWNEE
jgi:hypothetical protein